MRLLTLLLLFSFYFNVFAQEIDVAPFLTQCKEKSNLQESVDCSEKIIYDYFLMNIDDDLCPSSNYPHRYSIMIDVNKKGKASFNKIHKTKNDESCNSFFEKRAKEFCDDFKFVPASLKGKRQTFKKSIVFNYPKPIIPESDSTHVYQYSEQLPRFNACENIIGSVLDKDMCAKEKLIRYVYENIRYPKSSIDKGVSGMVVVQFVVDENGGIQEPKIVRDLGANYGKAVMDLMKKISKLEQAFIPGMQHGKNVKVKYTLPVMFRPRN